MGRREWSHRLTPHLLALCTADQGSARHRQLQCTRGQRVSMLGYYMEVLHGRLRQGCQEHSYRQRSMSGWFRVLLRTSLHLLGKCRLLVWHWSRGSAPPPPPTWQSLTHHLALAGSRVLSRHCLCSSPCACTDTPACDRG